MLVEAGVGCELLGVSTEAAEGVGALTLGAAESVQKPMKGQEH